MDDSSRTRKFAHAALFLCAASCVGFVLFQYGPLHWGFGDMAADTAIIVGEVLLLLACALVFSKPNIGYLLGVLGALLVMRWFIWEELFPTGNLWILLNGIDDVMPYRAGLIELGAVALSVASLVIVIVSSFLRLLPRRFSLREQTWPALATSLLVIAAWFAHSVTPYRVPMIVDGVHPDLCILHVNKHGSQFHETTVMGYRDRKSWITRNDRRLFQYRFYQQSTRGTMPEALFTRMRAVLESAELRKLRTGPAVNLRSWTAEGWYVAVSDPGILAFTTEYGTVAPPEIIALFNEFEKLPVLEQRRFPVQDVCLGFCYDPIAGLGFVFVNQRP